MQKNKTKTKMADEQNDDCIFHSQGNGYHGDSEY